MKTRMTIATAVTTLITVLSATQPAVAAPTRTTAAVSAAPVCGELWSSNSYKVRCRSWIWGTSYSAEGECTDGTRSIPRYGRVKFTGPANTWGDFSGFTCGPGEWLVYGRVDIR